MLSALKRGLRHIWIVSPPLLNAIQVRPLFYQIALSAEHSVKAEPPAGSEVAEPEVAKEAEATDKPASEIGGEIDEDDEEAVLRRVLELSLKAQGLPHAH
eukprot:5056853-Pleurochrysis_carterae.AAC.1